MLAGEDLLVHVGQKIAERKRVPLFKRLRHDRVIGEVEALGADIKRLVEGKPLRLQNAQKFGDRDNGVRVVELEAPLLGERTQIFSALFEFSDDILQARAHHEVLLTQAQDLADHRVVVGVQDVRDLGRVEILRRLDLAVHFVETRKIELLHRLALPKAERIDDAVFVAENGHIVGNGAHRLIGELHEHRVALDAHAPRIPPFEPVVPFFVLEPVDKRLTEQPVAVADAEAVERDVLARRALQIARRKAA